MENNNSLRLSTEERGGDGYVESSAEYILPDYNPDLRKLLYACCEVKPAGKFSADEQVDFSGIVEYRCIYTDKDGELSEISFTSDYEYGVSLLGDAIDADSFPWVQNYQVRVLGPRKISAKASLVCENIYTNEKDMTGDEIPDGEDIELDKKKVLCGRLKRVESEERELAEEISRLDGVSIEEVTVISSAADTGDTTFERDGSEGRCKSDFMVDLLYRDAEGRMIPVESVVSGEGVIGLDGVPEGADVICTPHILSERFECLPGEDGVSIVANLIVRWDAVCVYNEEQSIITDAYSTDFALENRYSAVNLVSYGAPIREEMTKGGIIAPDAECGKIKEVLMIGERARITEKRVENGILDLGVELKIQGVVSCCDDEGNTTYAPIKISDNIAKKVNLCSEKRANQGAIVRISNTDIEQKIDGNTVKYTAAVALDVIPYDEISERVLISAQRNENEKVEKTSGRVTVYYTEPSDTLFSVAKRYHTTTAALLESNEITVTTSGGDENVKLPKRLIVY